MSLDVYLKVPGYKRHNAAPRIFVRENGTRREISEQEWEELNEFDGTQPVTVLDDTESEEVYSDNITHNLNKMADAAGIYEYLWRPEEVGVSEAAQLIAPLATGLALLESDPERFKAHNPPNGWGNYDTLCRFVTKYLAACREYPNAIVGVSR